jgi:hypothetical protein
VREACCVACIRELDRTARKHLCREPRRPAHQAENIRAVRRVRGNATMHDLCEQLRSVT